MPDEGLIKQAIGAPNYVTFGEPEDDLSEPDHVNLKVQANQIPSERELSPRNVPNFVPVFLILISSFLFSGMHCAVRFITNTYAIPSNFIAFYRGFIQVLLCGIVILCFSKQVFREPFTPRSFALLNLRGLVGGLTMLLKYATLARLPVVVAISLFSTTPIFASLFGWIFLQERLKPRDLLALVMTTIGAGLVGSSEPGSILEGGKARYGHGVLYGLLAAAGTGAVLMLMRAMGTKVNFTLSVFSLGVFAMISPFVLYLIQSGGWNETVVYFADNLNAARGGALVSLWCVGLFACSAAMCVNRGSQFTSAGRAAVIRTADIPVNYIVAFLTLGELPTSWSEMAGCSLIALSTYLVASKGAS